MKFNILSSGSSMKNGLFKHLLNAEFYAESGWQRKLLLLECVYASGIGDKRDKAFLIKIQHSTGSKINFWEIYI